MAWVVLSVLYLVALCVVFVGFASYVLRAEWQAAIVAQQDAAPGEVRELDTALFAIERAALLRTQIVQAEGLVSEAAAAQIDLERQRDAALADAIELRIRQSATATALYDAVDQTADVLSPSSAETLRSFLNRARAEGLPQGDQALALLRDLAQVDGRGQDEAAALEAQLSPLLEARDTARQQEQDMEERATQLAGEIRRVEVLSDQARANILAAQDEIALIETQVPLGYPIRARHGTLESGFVGLQAIQTFVGLPSILLILIVTMATGALGALVAETRNAGRQGLTSSGLLLHVVEGTVAALAVFLLSGAGMLALSTQANEAGEIALSPYTVAFLAFVSGFMSDRAFVTIRNAGERMFRERQDVEETAAAASEQADTTPTHNQPSPNDPIEQRGAGP